MKQEAYVKVDILENGIEAQLLESILKERAIPHRIQSYHDTAYNGLYQTQKGWGQIRAPLSRSEEIKAILSEIRTTQISP